MYLDDGQTSAEAVYDREFVNSTDEQPSLSSMVLKFKGKTENTLGYAVLFNPEAEFEKSPARIPSFRHGLLEFDINYTDNITNKKFDLIAVQNGWGRIPKVEIDPIISSETWTHISLDLGSYIAFDQINSVVRFGFAFKGISNSNKATAQVHIDNIKFTQNGGSPERGEAETLADGWENMVIDVGYNSSVFESDYDVYRTSPEHESISSLKLTFNTNDINGDYFITFNPENEAGLAALPNLHTGILDFDIKFSDNVTNHDVRIKAIQQDPNNWDTYATTEPIAPASVGGNWMHVTYNFVSDAAFNPITSCIRLSIIFDGINDSNRLTAQINIDNLRLIPAETLENGWENMAIDTGYNGSNFETDLNTYKSSESHESTSSLKLTFDGATPINGDYCVTFSPQGAELNPLPNLHAGTLDFDIKFSDNVTNHQLRIKAIQEDPNWAIYATTAEIDPNAGGDGWMHVTYDFSSNSDFDNITSCIRLIIIFDGVNDLNHSTAQISIDNLLFTLNA